MAIPHIPADIWNVEATILRATVTYNERREPSRAWSTVGTTDARLDRYRYSGSTAAYAEQGIEDLPSHKLFCPAGTGILPGDRVTVSGITYEVLEAFEPGGYAHHREVWLKHAAG